MTVTSGFANRLKDIWHRGSYLAAVAFRLRGTVARTCLVCGTTGSFRAFGHPPRYDAQCRRCGSLERHRLLCLALQSEPVLRSNMEALHFAPESALVPYFRPKVARYVTADLEEAKGDLVLNIEQMSLEAESVDVVIASHVLEHVDDVAALGELHRILRPGGTLIVMVPIIEGWDITYENDRILRPEDRTAHFGQFDHVRWYGRDFRDRIRAARFELREFVATGEDVVRYGLTRGERVFFARKGSVSANAS